MYKRYKVSYIGFYDADYNTESEQWIYKTKTDKFEADSPEEIDAKISSLRDIYGDELFITGIKRIYNKD